MTDKSSEANNVPDTSTQDDGFKEFVRTMVIALIVALTIRTLAFEPFNIPSSSMVPSLLIGDFLFVSKFSYGYGGTGTFWGMAPFSGRILAAGEPQRGDVVVFKWPHDNSTDYIKRLIGLPGDTIQMRQGQLYVNGVPVDRDRLDPPVGGDHYPPTEHVTDYLEHLPGGITHVIRKMGEDMPLDNTQVFVVPAHHYFFMGDNRDNSQDSRAPKGGVGYVPEENLVGKAEFLFFSLDGDAAFWQFWKWPSSVRWSRLFTKIH